MYANKLSINSESGIAFPILALFLGVVFLIGGLIVDSGMFYVRYAEIQNVTHQSANDGMLELEEILKKTATINKNNICSNLENVPNICTSNSFWSFLSDSEITNSISRQSNKILLEQVVQNFAISFDPRKNITSDDIKIHFPYDYQIGEKIKLKVTINTEPIQFFSQLLPRSRNKILAESIAFLEINR